jgi:hypothetical protein
VRRTRTRTDLVIRIAASRARIRSNVTICSIESAH